MAFLPYKHSYANSGFKFSPLLMTILGQACFCSIITSVKEFLEVFGVYLRVCLILKLLLPKADFTEYGFSAI